MQINFCDGSSTICYQCLMLLKAIYVQLIVLSLTLLWFAVSQRRSNFDLVLKTLAVGVLLCGLWLGSVWLFPPYWVLGVIAILFAVIAAFKWRSLNGNDIQKSSKLRTCMSNAPVLIIGPLGAYLGIMGYLGHGQTSEGLVIDLSPPFKTEQKACVMSGGLNSLVNQHNFSSIKPEDIGQTYGLDVIRTGALGFRTRRGYRVNPKPKDYAAYNIFDTEVYAPCAGLIVWSENNQADQMIGRRDRSWTSGNGVTLACQSVHIKLSHMKKGSVLVVEGERVEVGQPLGRIGNSGNTEEPHLHIHAETVVEEGNPWSHGQPVHMRFDGRLMARGDCF